MAGVVATVEIHGAQCESQKATERKLRNKSFTKTKKSSSLLSSSQTTGAFSFCDRRVISSLFWKGLSSYVRNFSGVL